MIKLETLIPVLLLELGRPTILVKCGVGDLGQHYVKSYYAWEQITHDNWKLYNLLLSCSMIRKVTLTASVLTVQCVGDSVLTA